MKSARLMMLALLPVARVTNSPCRAAYVADESSSFRYATAPYTRHSRYSGGRLAAELRYGLEAFGGVALLTPYGGFALAEGGSRSSRVGTRFRLGPSFDLSLEGSRRERARSGATPEHGLMLSGAVRW